MPSFAEGRLAVMRVKTPRTCDLASSHSGSTADSTKAVVTSDHKMAFASGSQQGVNAMPSSCRLLSLLAELRNYIYDLVFTEQHDKAIDLSQGKPPSKAMLLVCRQVYKEASSLYKQAYRRYWTENSFELVITPADLEQQSRGLDLLKGRDCEQLAKVELRGKCRMYWTSIAYACLGCGLWRHNIAGNVFSSAVETHVTLLGTTDQDEVKRYFCDADSRRIDTKQNMKVAWTLHLSSVKTRLKRNVEALGHYVGAGIE